MTNRKALLRQPIEHLDITAHNVVPVVDAMRHMAYTARDLARAAWVYDKMLRDPDCGVILCLAGSLVSAGLKQVFVDLVRNRMVDAVVSTGANIVDQDFFEGLGFRHYVAEEKYRSGMFDAELRAAHVDRIYDTFIDEDELRVCDEACRGIADALEPRPYSSCEFIRQMGAFLHNRGKGASTLAPLGSGSGERVLSSAERVRGSEGPRTKRSHQPARLVDRKHPSPGQQSCPPSPRSEQRGEGLDCLVLAAYEMDVPIFCPAFSDCSAGFGLVAHQHQRRSRGKPMVSIDSAKDFYELTQLKVKNPVTGLFMIGGGVPENFAQDIVVAADLLGRQVPMHQYAVQVTVADVRDGALSSSTLKEASSWGKVDTAFEQMVYSEATLAVPLIAGYAYHRGAWKDRPARRFDRLFRPRTGESKVQSPKSKVSQ